MGTKKSDLIEERLKMVFEEKRLESFKIWPYTDKDPCNKKKLAEAGFFWTGTKESPDSAQCFVCLKSLDGWESTDDPWEEHKNHTTACPFVLIGKVEEDLTLEQFQDLWMQMSKNIIQQIVTSKQQGLVDRAAAIKTEIINLGKKTINNCRL